MCYVYINQKNFFIKKVFIFFLFINNILYFKTNRVYFFIHITNEFNKN
jgi:hypothetical protein